MTKKLIATAAFALASLISSPSFAETTLRVTAAPAGWLPMFQEIVTRFEGQYPDISVDIQANIRNFEALTEQTLREAIVGDLPDLSITGSNQILPLVERQLAVDLSPFIDGDRTWDDAGYTNAAAKTGQVNGRQYGLTLAASLPIIVFNKKLVSRVYEDPEKLPTTWPEIISLARTINSLDGNTLGLFFEHDSSGNWTYQALLNAAGGTMGTEFGQVAFDSEAGMEALNIIREIGEAGQTVADMSRDQARQAFSAGKMGMLVTASSGLGNFIKQAGNAFEIGVAPLPIPHPAGRIPAAGLSAVMFSDNDEKAKAAWLFLRFMMTPTAQEIFVKRTGMVPMNENVIADQQSFGTFYAQNPLFVAAMANRELMTRWYAFPGANSNRIVASVQETLQQVVTLKMTPEQAMADMQNNVSKMLKQ
ncbi:extracellular solute-binding protein (plasmid) [Mesorhizobium sp. AR10]|uniref:extracellular solute-binding protein n=1 Tax=Mesorhizobium sp. AR10 TaxID=2865839 RepID=UPI0021609DFF|nr:extracellular solute-binding protein [Mesorhizobium sp. AR10]UVK35510.1 extracellular solute-binding protein [Mesorhizobium sp. AR10]